MAMAATFADRRGAAGLAHGVSPESCTLSGQTADLSVKVGREVVRYQRCLPPHPAEQQPAQYKWQLHSFHWMIYRCTPLKPPTWGR